MIRGWLLSCRPGLLIDADKKTPIEIKAKQMITKQDIEQFWNYLKGSEYKLGFLINFGPQRLTIKRVVYDKAREKNSA